jgi:hypothetical protein
VDIYKKIIALSLVLIVNMFVFNIMGQSKVYILGQNVSNVPASKLSKIIQLRTYSPVVTLKLAQRSAGTSKKTFLADRFTRLMISSIVPDEEPRNLSASISPGVITGGTVLKLHVLHPNENFNGYPGTIGSEITLNEADKTIISEIGTCYSGKASHDGWMLEYMCELSSRPGSLAFVKGKTVTVTLTVTEET